MKTSLRALAATALTALALAAPSAAVAHGPSAPGPQKTLTVGVDVAAGWLWSSGSPRGCSVFQKYLGGISVSFTDSDEARLIEAKHGGVLEITGCGTLTEVKKMAKTTTKKKVVGDGVFLLGPHFTKGGVYKPQPVKGSFWDGSASGASFCGYTAHTSIAAFDESFVAKQTRGRNLKVTGKMKVIETDGDCVWKRIR